MPQVKTLLLFTGSYPFSIAAEQTFLEPELEHLHQSFDQVIIVPASRRGYRHPLPVGIQLEESFAANRERQRGQKQFFLALLSSVFYHELFIRPRTLIQLRVLKSLIKFVADVEYTRKWITKYIKNKDINLQSTLFYTYWLDSFTAGIALKKERYPKIKLVSKAHGYDLYLYRRTPPYIPYRAQTLKYLDHLFLISENGKQYISEQYPWFTDCCEIARLGVKDHGFVTSSSIDGVFRIVSCSFTVPVKRLDLLLEGIAYAARFRPNQKFEWHHLGSGPMSAQLESTAKELKYANLKCFFHGHLPNEEVISFYREYPVDVFMNVSESEGIPVSIMEAQSCGIPVIASAVGGIPEIVWEKHGRLLSTNPTTSEIAEAIFEFLDNRTTAKQMRFFSRQVWRDRYNAEKNYQSFSQRLVSLVGKDVQA